MCRRGFTRTDTAVGIGPSSRDRLQGGSDALDRPHLPTNLVGITKITGQTFSEGSPTSPGLARVGDRRSQLYRTYVGAVATVEVNRRSRQLRVKHLAVVRDCGQIINPDGVKNQIEGVLQTVSRTLKGSHVQPLGGDERRLGQLSDPHVP